MFLLGVWYLPKPVKRHPQYQREIGGREGNVTREGGGGGGGRRTRNKGIGREKREREGGGSKREGGDYGRESRSD